MITFEPGDRVIDMRDGRKGSRCDGFHTWFDGEADDEITDDENLRHDVPMRFDGSFSYGWDVGGPDAYFVCPCEHEVPAWGVWSCEDEDFIVQDIDSGLEALRVACAIAAGRWSST